jgi:GPH family glycoside/pentoside/hexuronide:cation symporter
LTVDGERGDIPRWNAIVYASASFGGNLLSRTSQLWLLFYYAPPSDAGMPTIIPRVLLGVILIVIGVEDAFADALIGYWSDRTNSRWGRRIPFVVVSTPFYALMFFLLFTPPVHADGLALRAAYFIVIVLMQRTTSSMSGGPFGALLPEISRTPASRMSIVVWQVAFGSLGAALALTGTGFIKDAYGFHVMAGIAAILALLSRYLGLWGAWPYARVDVPPVTVGIREAIRETFTNGQFLSFVPSNVLFNAAVTMLLSALPFFADSVILGHEKSRTLSFAFFTLHLRQGAISSMLAGTAILAVIATLPFIYWLAGRWGKARVYAASMLAGTVTFSAVFFMGMIPGVDRLWQSVVFVAATGLGIGGVFVFPNAIMADIIDYDAQRSGERREAFFYGALNTVEKLGASFNALILAGVFLFGATAENSLGIRLVGPVAAAATLLGLYFFRNYRIADSAGGGELRQP